jgi:cellobiose phosphorylase
MVPEVPADGQNDAIEFETDRAHFLGRGRTPANPEASGAALNATGRHVLDPIFSLRRPVTIQP